MTRSLVTRSLVLRPLALLCLALPLGARALGAQDVRPTAGTLPAAPASATTVEDRLRAIPDPAVRSDIAELIVEATRRGLPADPLVTKALEGVEKGAPPARIAAAVRATAGRLVAARDALAPVLSATDLRAGVDALGAGVSPDVLRHVREAAAARPVAVPVGVVAQLAARGVPADKAGAAVVFLLKNGAGTAQLLALQQDVQQDLSVGMSPSKSLDLRVRALTSTLPPPTPLAAPSAGDFAPQELSTPRSTPQTPRKKP